MSYQTNIMFFLFSTVAPKILLSTNRLIAEEKQSIRIACSATGQPLPSITWSKAVGNVPQERTEIMNGNLTIHSVTKNDGGTYICKAENILGSATDTAQLMIFPPLRFKVSPPQELTPMIGSSLRLPCVAESDLRTTIAWTKDGMSSLPVESRVLQNETLLITNIKIAHKGSYTCRATNALRTIETKVKINPIVGSCSVIRKYISSASGNYVIDPDGAGGLAPFTVYCDMSDKNEAGVTVISHDSESRTHVDGCNPAGCYSRDIHYIGVNLSQLASLTRVSSHCEQFIKYECYDSMIFRWEYGWWLSRDSTKMTYWGGASPGSGKCACGMTNSCANPSYGCNCDKNDRVWREDSGLLTDKTHLPVKQLRFGDTGSSFEQGYHTLGKLKCYGIA